MEQKIKKFISSLANTKVSDSACNFFSFDSPANEIRRNNLYLYFLQMLERKPHTMLVGEAPGYQGSRWTGVNFCSEHIILSGIPEIGMFGKVRGYEKTTEWEKIWKEPSATIVWGAMAQVKQLPIIWASFPFHPFKTGTPLTNRTPTKDELLIGKHFIKELIAIFDIKTLIAVGNKGEETLKEMGHTMVKIRHPAHGGATLFREGVKKYLS